MKEVIGLNKEIPCENENMDVMISELVEREEFACTANGTCLTQCGIDSYYI